MPELPEIQAHADRLTDDFAGSTLGGFSALSFTALKTYAPAPDQAIGTELVTVGRRGKYLLLEHPSVTFVVHLMQGGRLKPDAKQSPKPRGGLARWRYEDGRALLLTEAGTEKKAGVWVIDSAADIGPDATIEPFAGLGPDADRITLEQLRNFLAGNSRRVHGFLRDQHVLAGVGRRLANEICHRARISPFANASKLSADESRRLFDALGSCIDESLAYERSRADMSSSKERPGNVHHREREACPVCGDLVRAVEYNHYTVNYCATCQTDGKVLADNTTSRFLK